MNPTADTAERVRRIEQREKPADRRPYTTGSDIALLRITGVHANSPASGPAMYTGSIYANGPTASATETGVTIRIPGIDDQITSPSYGDWDDLPFCLGLPIVETWTGADSESVTETVYQALALLLLA